MSKFSNCNIKSIVRKYIFVLDANIHLEVGKDASNQMLNNVQENVFADGLMFQHHIIRTQSKFNSPTSPGGCFCLIWRHSPQEFLMDPIQTNASLGSRWHWPLSISEWVQVHLEVPSGGSWDFTFQWRTDGPTDNLPAPVGTWHYNPSRFGFQKHPFLLISALLSAKSSVTFPVAYSTAGGMGDRLIWSNICVGLWRLLLLQQLVERSPPTENVGHSLLACVDAQTLWRCSMFSIEHLAPP